MFEEVCGLDFENIAIVTTHWDAALAANKRPVELEQELVTGKKYFKPLCDAGAHTFGHNNTRDSAQRVMDMLLNKHSIILQMQGELDQPQATLEQTSAGS